MMKSSHPKSKKRNIQKNSFQQLAGEKSPGLAAEFLDFLLHNKKWWLIPIIVMLLFLGLIAMLGGTGAAPFIYTLF
jgi:hypothetical protein